ncbi:MAG TPA: DinB family protein [Bryobacteraceae bacterium]|nr:DinB family protein [Bryobacteraceae bacterium]
MVAAGIAAELDRMVESARDRLLAMGEDDAARRPAAESWAKKEILGHLIDSAANNHQRFVRLQAASGLVFPSYQQNDWVRIQHYAARPWRDLVELWLAYNRHLAHVMRHTDAEAASHIWKSPAGDRNLSFVMDDYMSHLRHHLDQILS